MKIASTATGWVVWNLFLAFVPVALAQVIYWMVGRAKEKRPLLLPAAVLGVVWLVFLPNTCYLLTEWRHFLFNLDVRNLYLQSQADSGMRLRLMIYTAFYACYSGVGLLAFALAVRPIARLAKQSGATMWVYGTPLFLLSSVGVYLGLKPRFNSWEFVQRPWEIWASAAGLARNPMLAGLAVAFGGFLWLAYVAIDIWIDGLLSRCSGLRSGRRA